MSASPGREQRPSRPTKGDTPTSKDRRFRKPVSCKPCRQSKLRCDRHSPCSTCKRRDCVVSCTYESKPPNQQSQSNPDNVLLAANPSPRAPIDSQTLKTINHTAALPNSNSLSTAQSPLDFAHDHWDAILRRPISQMGPTPHNRINPFSLSTGLCFPWSIGPKIEMKELMAIIPAPHYCEYLINHYFQHMSPLFHILHGPTFEKDYRAFVRDPSKTSRSWLALILMVLSMAVHAIDDEDALLRELCPQTLEGFKPEQIAHQYRTAALIALSLDNFLIHHDLNTLEAVLLLIYAINHWEGVEYSWVLLGKLLFSRNESYFSRSCLLYRHGT
jgi:hypothetical protein